MTLSLTLACIWALAATAVAFLPMRLQYIPGLLLLLAAVPLLVYLAVQHSVWVMLLALAAVLSMFRNPLRYIYRHVRGLPTRHKDERADPR